MDSAVARWASIEQTFTGRGMLLNRIPGIDGFALDLPIAEYSEGLYRWFHGRPTRPGEVGCYLSHVRAIQAFLASDEETALIGEDDLTLGPDFETVVAAAMGYANHWNILRLTGLGTGRAMPFASLGLGYSLCVGMGRMKGLGAYIIDRAAARKLVDKLLPMRLPIDHALDREWFFGLRGASLLPFPASQMQAGFRSSIQMGESLRLSGLRRILATYPYQFFNEVMRWLFRGTHYLWIRFSLNQGADFTRRGGARQS